MLNNMALTCFDWSVNDIWVTNGGWFFPNNESQQILMGEEWKQLRAIGQKNTPAGESSDSNCSKGAFGYRRIGRCDTIDRGNCKQFGGKRFPVLMLPPIHWSLFGVSFYIPQRNISLLYDCISESVLYELYICPSIVSPYNLHPPIDIGARPLESWAVGQGAESRTLWQQCQFEGRAPGGCGRDWPWPDVDLTLNVGA